MRIVVDPRPSGAFAPLPEAWHLIRQPRPALGLGLSILAGLGLPFVPFVLLSLESWLLPRPWTHQSESVPPWILLPALLFSVVAHELLHLTWHPGGGVSPRSLVLLWPRKLQLGVYYDGFMSRRRWLVMRLAPVLGLTALPTLALLIIYPWGMSFFWQQFIVIVILINSLGAGGDLLASAIVARQVPRDGEVGNWHGRACWRREQHGPLIVHSSPRRGPFWNHPPGN